MRYRDRLRIWESNYGRSLGWTDGMSSKKVFSIETLCQKCQVPLRLISLIKSEAIAKTILTSMHQPVEVPELHPARPPPRQYESEENWVNRSRRRFSAQNPLQIT